VLIQSYSRADRPEPHRPTATTVPCVADVMMMMIA